MKLKLPSKFQEIADIEDNLEKDKLALYKSVLEKGD